MKNPNDAFSFVTPNLPAVSSYAWVFLIVFTCTELVCFGHGSVSDPVSRVYRIFLENPESPDRPVSADAIAVAGTQPFYDWSEVNRLVPDYAVDNLDAYRSLMEGWIMKMRRRPSPHPL